jgi:hypothetical protein
MSCGKVSEKHIWPNVGMTHSKQRLQQAKLLRNSAEYNSSIHTLWHYLLTAKSMSNYKQVAISA